MDIWILMQIGIEIGHRKYMSDMFSYDWGGVGIYLQIVV